MVKTIPQTLPVAFSEEKKENSWSISEISKLETGDNPSKMVSLKVVNNLDRLSDVPMCFLVVDYKHNFCVISIYHTSKDLLSKMKAGTEIFIKNPTLTLIQLSFKGYQYNY